MTAGFVLLEGYDCRFHLDGGLCLPVLYGWRAMTAVVMWVEGCDCRCHVGSGLCLPVLCG